MIFWLITGIYLMGILTIFLLDKTSHFITRLIPILKGRMRLVFNYITVLVTICAYIVYLYTLHPFNQNTEILGIFNFSPFSSIFQALSSLSIVFSGFFLLSDVDEFGKKSKISYSSLLFIQYSAFIMFSAYSWIYIYLGLLGIIMGITFIMRNFALKKEDELKKELHSFFVFDILSIVFLFLGILFYNLVFDSFTLPPKTKSIFESLEILSFIFVLSSALILLEIPPFHFRSFSELNKQVQTPNSLRLFKKLVGIFLILNLSRSISVNSNYKQFYFLTFLIMGGIASLWGVIGTIRKMNINELLVYIDFYYIGTLFLLLSHVFIPKNPTSSNIESYSLILFLTIFYFLIQITQTSLMILLTSKYANTSIEDFQNREKLEQVEIFPFTILLFAEMSFPLALSYIYTFYLNFNELGTLFFIILLSLSSLNFLLGILCSFRVISYAIKRNSVPIVRQRIEPNLYITLFISLFILVFNIVFIEEIVIVCQKAVFLFPF